MIVSIIKFQYFYMHVYICKCFEFVLICKYHSLVFQTKILSFIYIYIQ